jgi:hypothetical protein
VGTGPAADIIRGGYVNESLSDQDSPSSVTRATTSASRTWAPGRRPTSSAAGTSTPTAGDTARALRPCDRRTASPARVRGLLFGASTENDGRP